MSDRLLRVQGGKYWRDTVTGKVFTTPNAWREYLKRSAFGDWSTRAPVTDSPIVRKHTGCRIEVVAGEGLRPNGLTDSGSIRKSAIKVQATPRLKAPPKSDTGIRVKPVNGVWRRYLVQADGTLRYVADYATTQDALDCRSPIADYSDVDRSYVVNQKIEG